MNVTKIFKGIYYKRRLTEVNEDFDFKLIRKIES